MNSVPHTAEMPRPRGLAPQLLAIPAERREECGRELHQALATLQTERGVPYTIHQLHVHVVLAA